MKKTLAGIVALVLLAILIAIAPKENKIESPAPTATEQAQPERKQMLASASNAEVKTVQFTIKPQLGTSPVSSNK